MKRWILEFNANEEVADIVREYVKAMENTSDVLKRIKDIQKALGKAKISGLRALSKKQRILVKSVAKVCF